MEVKQTKRRQLISRVLATVMVLCLVFGMAITTNAATVNQAVTDAKSGVVQIQVWFVDTEAGVDQYLHSGTGFLINEDTVVTCQHVATGFPDWWYIQWTQITNEGLGGNRTVAQVKEGLELRISVYRDVYVKANIKKASTEMDYAVLALEEKIHNRTPLKLRDSSELRQTEEVFALGFPGDMLALEDDAYFDPDSVTITSGHVNKVGDMSYRVQDEYDESKYIEYQGVNCVESSALITGGNSGGPLLDADGNVVGINAAGSDTRNIAISSKQLIDVLSALGISYTPAGKTTEPSESTLDTGKLSDLIAKAEDKDADDYTEASFADLEDAIEAAKTALKATEQSEIDAAAKDLQDAIDDLEKVTTAPTQPAGTTPEEPKSGLDQYVMIGIIAFAAVVIIVVVIVLVVVLGKKKAAPQAAAPVAPVPVPPPAVKPVASVQPTVPVKPVAPAKPAAPSAGETTVLSQNAGETTVLSQSVNGGSLVRTGNNERIAISSAEFTIGRERNSVDYCVSGNTNISRVHARFVVRDGITYIVDNKAANGTFVNGVKARAGQEIELKDGDAILLADEKFEYKK